MPEGNSSEKAKAIFDVLCQSFDKKIGLTKKMNRVLLFIVRFRERICR